MKNPTTLNLDKIRFPMTKRAFIKLQAAMEPTEPDKLQKEFYSYVAGWLDWLYRATSKDGDTENRAQNHIFRLIESALHSESPITEEQATFFQEWACIAARKGRAKYAQGLLFENSCGG